MFPWHSTYIRETTRDSIIFLNDEEAYVVPDRDSMVYSEKALLVNFQRNLEKHASYGAEPLILLFKRF